MPLFPRSVLFPPSLAFDFSLWGTFPPSLSSAVSRCFLDGTWALQSASETHRCLSVAIPTWSPQRALCCGTDLCPPPARSLLCADDYRSVLRLLGHRAESSCEHRDVRTGFQFIALTSFVFFTSYGSSSFSSVFILASTLKDSPAFHVGWVCRRWTHFAFVYLEMTWFLLKCGGIFAGYRFLGWQILLLLFSTFNMSSH